MTTKVRLDKYLWSIRLFKTRTLAAAACDQGKVKHMGHAVKAAKHVGVGDEFEIKTEARKWIIKVTGIIDKRVQYPEAIKNYIDLTPAEDLEQIKPEASAFYTGKQTVRSEGLQKSNEEIWKGFFDQTKVAKNFYLFIKKFGKRLSQCFHTWEFYCNFRLICKSSHPRL